MSNILKRKEIRWVISAIFILTVAVFLIPEKSAKNIEADSKFVASSAQTASLVVPPEEAQHEAGNAENTSLNPGTNSVVDVQHIYARLYDANPEERLKALDEIWRFSAAFINNEKIFSRLEEMATDEDSRIAELTQLVLVNITELRNADDVQKGLTQQNGQALGETSEIESIRLGGMTNQELANMSVNTPPNYLNERMQHPDPVVRSQAIEEAMTQRDEQGIALLSEATHDPDANNRRIAVDGLQQMLSQGVGDGQKIVAILEQSALDPNPEIAEMARQAMDLRSSR